MSKPHTHRTAAKPAEWIHSLGALAELCTRLRAAGRFGIDTEFIGETSYWPILCLIQISTDHHVDLIDPLALPNLDPLGEMIADPGIVKICHAGEQDLAILYRHGGRRPAGVWDTQLLAGLIGIGYPLSYGKLVEYFCGVNLEKAHTYSEWRRRPLTPAQLEYAVDDVLYLPSMERAISQRLTELNRNNWATALCDELCASASTPPDPRQMYLKIKVSKSFGPLQMAVLQALAAWREQIAFEHNMPARTLLPDTVLRDIAKLMPQRIQVLNRLEDFPHRERKSYGPAIMELIRQVKDSPPESYPPPPHELDVSPHGRSFEETIWAAAQVICLGQSVCTQLVESQSRVMALADALRAGADVSGHPVMQGWRYECLGRHLEAFAHGRSQLNLTCSGSRMQLRLQ